MGKGLSPLQTGVIGVLRGFPTYENSIRADSVTLRDWAMPKDIFAALGIAATPSTRAIMSRALDRLYRRGLVAKFHGEVAVQGKSARYALITDPKNAGAGTWGPAFILSRRTPKMRTPQGSIDAEYIVSGTNHTQD